MYIPWEEEGLIQVVEDIDDKVIVGGGVDVGPRKLAVDENDLLWETQRPQGAVCYLPCEEQVRILPCNHRRPQTH